MPKPEILIQHLRGMLVDPAATRQFEMMSGGFFWSDERPPNYSDSSADYALRCVLAYRASLTRGKPREQFRSVWDAVIAGCPQWPGFLAERRSPELAAELDRASKSGLKSLDRLDRALGKAKDG
jgi:hypothetical protein